MQHKKIVRGHSTEILQNYNMECMHYSTYTFSWGVEQNTQRYKKNNDKLFSNTLLVHSGNFRQKLPVIPRPTYADEINACFKSSPSADTFSNQLLDIGDEKVTVTENTGCIKLPTDFCTIVDSKNAHIWAHIPRCTHKIHKSCLAGRNGHFGSNVNDLNFKIQQSFPGDLISYKSINTVCDANKAVNYPAEFLNSLDLPGMPSYLLRLKVKSQVILLRNLNPPRLSNGTRLVIKKLIKNSIGATILNGKFRDKNVLLPRTPMIPTDVPIEFKRAQFPFKLAFAMTLNRSQGQAIFVCGLYLGTPCF